MLYYTTCAEGNMSIQHVIMTNVTRTMSLTKCTIRLDVTLKHGHARYKVLEYENSGRYLAPSFAHFLCSRKSLLTKHKSVQHQTFSSQDGQTFTTVDYPALLVHPLLAHNKLYILCMTSYCHSQQFFTARS